MEYEGLRILQRAKAASQEMWAPHKILQVINLTNHSIYGKASCLHCCLSLDFRLMTMRRKLCTCSLHNLWRTCSHRPSLKGPLSFLLWLLWCCRKELRGAGRQNKRWGNHLHRPSPADLKRTGEMPRFLREMKCPDFLKQCRCAMTKEKLQKLVCLISSLN